MGRFDWYTMSCAFLFFAKSLQKQCKRGEMRGFRRGKYWLLAMQPHQWKLLTEEQYGQLFPQSAIERAGYEGLMRNIAQLDHR